VLGFVKAAAAGANAANSAEPACQTPACNIVCRWLVLLLLAAAALFAQAGDHDAATSDTRTLSRAAISAYHSEGMKMVGVLKRSNFKPSMPVVAEDALQNM
jgi:hypothetical protein